MIDRANQEVSGRYAGKVFVGRIVHSADTPFGEPIHKVELEYWLSLDGIIDTLYLTESELGKA
jgi:hypothetical protein